MATGGAGQGGHPQSTLDKIRRKIAADVARLADPAKTFASISADMDEFKALIAPYRGTDPLVGSLADTLQTVLQLCGGLAAQIESLVGGQSGDAVQPTPEPVTPAVPVPPAPGPAPATPVVDPSRQ